MGGVNGEMGLKGYCHIQSVTLGRFRSKAEMFWYPYTSRKLRLLRRAMDLLFRSRLGRLLGN